MKLSDDTAVICEAAMVALDLYEASQGRLFVTRNMKRQINKLFNLTCKVPFAIIRLTNCAKGTYKYDEENGGKEVK